MVRRDSRGTCRRIERRAVRLPGISIGDGLRRRVATPTKSGAAFEGTYQRQVLEIVLTRHALFLVDRRVGAPLFGDGLLKVRLRDHLPSAQYGSLSRVLRSFDDHRC